MKEILELLLKLGWDIPNWLIITLFVLVVIGIICVIIKKNIVPITHKVIKIKQDLDSIEEIKKEQSKLKDEQMKAMETSIEGDKALKEDVDTLRGDISALNDKVDKIVELLDKRWAKEDQAEMSRAQNRLLEMYKKFYLNNESKEWTRYESEVFHNTLQSYTSHGGNSFIANEVVPQMQLLTVVDK